MPGYALQFIIILQVSYFDYKLPTERPSLETSNLCLHRLGRDIFCMILTELLTRSYKSLRKLLGRSQTRKGRPVNWKLVKDPKEAFLIKE